MVSSRGSAPRRRAARLSWQVAWPALCAAAVVVAPARARAQAVRVQVREARAGTPVPWALVTVFDTAGRPGAAGATGSAGARLLPLPGAGVYRVQVRRVGYQPFTSPPFRAGPADTVALTVAAPAVPVTLAAVRVTGRTQCDVRTRTRADDEALVAVWEQVRTAVALSADRAEPGPPVAFRRYVAWLAPDGGTPAALTGFGDEASAGRPFGVWSLEALDERGYVWREAGRELYLVPDERALLSDAFAAQHCFRLVRGSGETAGLLGVAFSPARGRRVPEVAGVLWVDSSRAMLRHLDYWYVAPQLPAGAAGPGRAGGEVHFAPLPSGRWAVVGWRLRVPTTDAAGRARVADVFAGSAARAVRRTPSHGTWSYVEAGGSTVDPPAAVTETLGRLRDRIAPGALEVRVVLPPDPALTQKRSALGPWVVARQRDDAGARRMLLGSPGQENRGDATAPALARQTARVDASGLARLADLPPGVYDVHLGSTPDPQLPEGVKPEEVQVATVRPGGVAQVTLSGRVGADTGVALARALCGRDPGAAWRVVHGRVRTPDGAPAAGVTIVARWTAPEGEAAEWRTRSASGGAFAFCRAPRGRPVTLTAADPSRGLSTASPTEVAASAVGWAVQSLVLAPGGAAATGSASPRPLVSDEPVAEQALDTVVTVSGVVRDSATGRGLAGAVVQFVHPETLQGVAIVTADAEGRYQVGPMRPGSYIAGFLHPLLDARGVDHVAVRVHLPGGAATLDLAAPPPRAGRTPDRGDTTRAPAP